jgi:hypothetical protein
LTSYGWDMVLLVSFAPLAVAVVALAISGTARPAAAAG